MRGDVVELGDEIRALDLDVQMPGVSEEAKTDYETALGAYERASAAVDRARSPQELEPVGAAVEEGRYAMASTRARLQGNEPPERTPPCFFDPRHGPSSRQVMWSPPWGEPREVPACEADAQRVERGEEPDPRQVTLGGRQVPYWNAGPAYAPYMGGFFGGGLLPGIFLGSVLGGGMFGGGYGGWGPGDSGGGGWDSGGGFGGGDFGGGDFGGGDFGGGGRFRRRGFLRILRRRTPSATAGANLAGHGQDRALDRHRQAARGRLPLPLRGGQGPAVDHRAAQL